MKKPVWRKIFVTVVGILIVLAALYLMVGKGASESQPPTQYVASTQKLCDGLVVPWQMRWLAPNSIIFTELAGSINKLDVTTGKTIQLYQVPQLAKEIQSGLMGLDLKGDQVYYVYNYYDSDSIWTRVETQTLQDDTLIDPQIVVDRIPAFAISNGGRLMIDSDQKLWLTVGEGMDSESAQELSSHAGKVLRFNIDGSVPRDNPSPESPIYSMGFRNPQGLVEGRGGIYVSEHGTFSNDEFNYIRAGGNYGWPLVSGPCLNDSCQGDGFEYPLDSWTPTVAPSGTAYYKDDLYPFLQNSMLVGCLKGQRIKVVALSEDGRDVLHTREMLVNDLGRIRDVLVNPEGRIFAATSNEDVYGAPTEDGDGVFEIYPQDSLVHRSKRVLNPPEIISLDSTQLEVSVVAEKLRLPWELVWVGNEKIWFNERGGAIKQLDLGTDKIKLIHQIDDVFESSDNSGMHGFTVHPEYPAKPFCYGHYTYELYKSRLVRYEVDPKTLKVVDEKILLPHLEGNKSHNGSRIVFGPDGKIYFCIGDGYQRRAAQKKDRFNGKVHRLNEDGSIPEDNPFPDSYIWTIGHRNPQGLAWAGNGLLYLSEHGSSNDDEINVLNGGANYGFPNVQGPCDEWSEQWFCERNDVVEPIFTWTPTIGPSGIDYYGNPIIPEWNNSLLICTLKSGDGVDGQRLLKLSLDESGRNIVETSEYLTYSFGRLRDVMVAPDGRVFICTSNQESNQNALEIVQSVDDRIIELRPKEKAIESIL